MKTSMSAQGYLYFINRVFNNAHGILPSTTINAKYKLPIGDTVITGNPELRYLGLGIGGTLTDSNGTIDLGLRHRDGSLSDLYAAIPLVIRDEGNDLSVAERNNYRIRVKTSIEGVPKIFYYLLDIKDRVNINNASLALKSSDTSGTVLDYTANEMTDIDTSGSVYFVAGKNLNILLTEFQTAELNNVFDTLYPELTINKVVSEVGLYAGIEETVDNIKETKGCQLILSSSTIIPINDNTISINQHFEIGGV